MQTPDSRIWGKEHDLPRPYPLLCHLLDTAAAAEAVWDLWLRPGLKELIASEIADGDEDAARRRIAAVAGLHDVGKASAMFQMQSGKRSRPEISNHLESAGYSATAADDLYKRGLSADFRELADRHEAMSLYELNGRQWPDLDDRVDGGWAAAAVGGHHGEYFPRPSGFERGSALLADMLRGGTCQMVFDAAVSGGFGEQLTSHRDAVLAVSGVTLPDLRSVPRDSGTVTILVTGIVCLADWLASSPLSVRSGLALLESVDVASEPSSWYADRVRYFRDVLPRTLGVYHDIARPREAILKGKTPTVLQRQAESIGSGLWVVTHPTGEGKTAAALLRHCEASGEGIIFALHTRSAADLMWNKIQSAYEGTPNAANLVHQHSALNSFYHSGSSKTGLRPYKWLSYSSNRIFAPVVTSTCDQVLMASLRKKWSPTRLLAVANKHVVLDEVHTFDAYQKVLLSELLAWLGETDTRVTLLSATLPSSDINAFASAYAGQQVETEATYPGHIVVDSKTSRLRSDVAPARREYDLQVTLDEVPQDAVTNAHVDYAAQVFVRQPGARIGIIVNTVARAMQVAEELNKLHPNVIVLHSRMTVAHRTEIGEQIEAMAGESAPESSPEQGLIVVATQVIEASVDVDFDYMSTDLAPTSSIVQRAGRIWRHSETAPDGTWVPRRGRTGNPSIRIVSAREVIDGDMFAARPYLVAELVRAHRVLGSLDSGAVAIPGDVQDIVDRSCPSDEEIDEAFVREGKADALVAEQSKNARKRSRATRNTIPFHFEQHKSKRVIGRIRYRHLTSITSNAHANEAQTRLIDEPTITLALYDPSENSRWGWPGDIEAMRAADEAETLREVQGATVSVSFRMFEKITGVEAGDAIEEYQGFNTALGEVIPVDINAVTYDNMLGLIDSTTHAEVRA